MRAKPLVFFERSLLPGWKSAILFSQDKYGKGKLEMYTTTRRQFSMQMLSAAARALLSGTILESSALAQAATPSGGELFSRMKWLNEPASATVGAGRLV